MDKNAELDAALQAEFVEEERRRLEIDAIVGDKVVTGLGYWHVSDGLTSFNE